MDDPYRDEDGEPLMDPDAPLDPELSPEPEDPSLDDEDDDWRRERSVTPVFDASASPEAAASAGKVRKRLVKKSDRRESSTGGFDDYMDDSEGEQTKKRKSAGLSSGGGKKERRLKGEKRFGRGSNGGGGRYGYGNDDEGESEIQEMWNTIAGNDSENDQEGMRTIDDDNFIDDSGVDPAHLYGSDHEGSAGNAPQAEEGEEDEIKKLFDSGKKKKKPEKTPAEIALLVESLMAELEVMAEEDAELNREGKPAINKLKKLPLLTDVLSKKQLYHEFLDHGVLTLLKNWLEPLPDGSLPNINIRETILKILTDLPIDLEQYDRREQLKKSGLGKVVMFLSRSDEETTANRKLAKELVDKWSRPIFNKSTRFEDMRTYYDERTPFCRSSLKKGSKSGQLASRRHASKPETLAMDFAVCPQSKIDPEEVRARSKRVVHDQRRLKMNKKLQQLKGPKKKQLQASKLSVEGRGMVKFL
ncbi:hypothetical protein QJS04_geneDACA021602 [Acorus gramineus]|uniref:TFIIS N-terminal domain-containing protein n=1 Tax=Acorus gramineus TaxID=55184 RepID=A0AAV9B749_ACOGR|nr:hypothetical protein QJS04_geneDACA021602 [Acorus gramineus]